MDLIGISGAVGAQRILNFLNKNGIKEQHGKAIAIGELVDCRPMLFHEDEEQCFVRYSPNLYCHIYKNVRSIIPIPFKGQQGWKRLDSKFMNKIEIE